MNFRGRHIDPVAFWDRYVVFPSGVKVEKNDAYLPKVQCPNPDHDTTKRHFQVNARDPYVHCFADCGISGSWEHAICILEGLYEKFKVDVEAVKVAWDKRPFDRSASDREHLRRNSRAKREARKIILRASGGLTAEGLGQKVAVAKSKAKSAPESAKVISPSLLQYESFLPPVALEYLAERGISSNSVSTWKLGWLPEEKRIAIPAADVNGVLKFLIKRAIRPQDQPKYLYTEGFPRTSILFGACQIDLGMIKSLGLGLVEGSIDTIIQHQHGLRIFGGILGTGISKQQRNIVARLRPRRIYLWFDKDSAGVHNIEIAANLLRKYPLYVVRYPKGKSDPAEVTEKEAWRQVDRAITLQQFNTRNGLSVRAKAKKKEISVG